MPESLRGRLILILEDEYLPALEAAEMVSRLGGAVQGPVARSDAARRLVDLERPDGAVLDVKLDGETSLALADELIARGVPIVFATGYESFALPDRFAALPRLSKPIDSAAFELAATRIFGATAGNVRTRRPEPRRRIRPALRGAPGFPNGQV